MQRLARIRSINPLTFALLVSAGLSTKGGDAGPDRHQRPLRFSSPLRLGMISHSPTKWSEAEIEEAIDVQSRALTCCVVRTKPQLLGYVHLIATVSPAGLVLTVGVDVDDVQSPGYLACLQQQIQRVQLSPVVSPGNIEIRIPLRLATKSTDGGADQECVGQR